MKNRKNTPPVIARWIIRQLAVYNDKFSISDDFDGEYEELFKSGGKIKARLWYWKQVFYAIAYYFPLSIFFGAVMFKSYLTVALRNIKKHKFYSFINVSGLSIGLATAILIMLWVKDELSYDRFHENHENIFRIIEFWPQENGSPATPYPLGPALQDSYPEVNGFVRLKTYGENLIKYEDKSFYENRFFFSDPNIFEVFTFPLVQGDHKKVLSEINSVVISEKMATKYFGKEEPVGKTLVMENSIEFIVSGVMRDIPHNSHLQFDFMANFELHISNGGSERWVDHQYITYIRLNGGTDTDSFNRKIRGYIHENGYDVTKIDIALQKIKDIHLQPLYLVGSSSGGGILSVYAYIFSIIAIGIVLIACINYMNLATAQSAARAKEIGVRKVMGAGKNQITKQYLFESVFVTLIALLFSLVLVYLLLPEFNRITGKNIDIKLFNDFRLLSGLILATLMTGLLAGSYPAVYLSSIQPVRVLKGIILGGSKRLSFRRILVTLQFTLSLVLLIGAFVIYSQIKFMKNVNSGINKENMLYIKYKGALRNNYESFKTEVKKHPDILSAASSSSIPNGSTVGSTGVEWEGMTEKYSVPWKLYSVDYDFFSTMKLEMVEGREFSQEIVTDDSVAYIINEAGAEVFEEGSPLGKRFAFWEREGTVIGVVKDFHIKSLHEEIDPLAISISRTGYRYLLLKINSQNIPEVISYIEELYREYNPDFPFEYNFLDEEYENLYFKEEKISNLVKYFSILAAIILSLGLFGLSSFTAEQRRKELGIRKVIGASQTGLAILFYKELFSCTIVANIIAWPAAWYIMNRWLENFAYKTSVNILFFVLSGLLTFAVAALAISIQATKAARANPVDSLRYE